MSKADGGELDIIEKENPKENLKDMTRQVFGKIGGELEKFSKGMDLDKLIDNVVEKFPPPRDDAINERMKVIPFKSKVEDDELDIKKEQVLKCPKCKLEVKKGEEATVVYGGSEKVMCDSCARKTPGVGNCFICHKRITKIGNFLANKKERRYSLFCHEDSCRAIVEIRAKQLNNAPPNKMLDNHITEKTISCICGKTENLKQCSQCKKVVYCSATCQRSHWSIHKQFCFFEK